MVVERKKIQALLENYPETPVIGAMASHSALDVFDGAVAEGFGTLAICQKGRERTYTHYFRSQRDPTGVPLKGCVDDALVLDKFSQIMEEDSQKKLRTEGVLLVPNRALSSYVEAGAIENDLKVPLVGSRSMLRLEERGEKENYYTLLGKAGLPIPEQILEAKAIDGLCVVKLPHAQKPLERGFFTCASFEEYQKKSRGLISQGVINDRDLAQARIERYVVGPIFNLNFFFSPIASRFEGLELLGIDERRESSLDGLVRLPADQQLTLPEKERIPGFRVVGHSSLTLRESLLEEAFHMGERFVDAAHEKYEPGVIGPFCLQTAIDKDGKFVIFDVSLRIGGGTNIHMALGHPYGNTLWRVPMSSGRRIALEVRRALADGALSKIVT
jgi:5-formaminoimidazole-4-carboxamide-1-(beta)-D-ribofuranosyl 5'-monophosphate synthetase